MSLEQAILDRLEKRNAQIEMLQQTIQAMSRAADAEREHARQQLAPLIEENKKLAAQIDSDEKITRSNYEHMERQIAALRGECEQMRREVPLESTREGLKNAVAKLQEVNAQLDSAKGEAEEWLKQCHAARRQRDDVKEAARAETQRLSDVCSELQSKYESLLAKITDLGSYAMTLGRKEGEPLEMFMERQALRLAALESQAGKIGYVAKGEHEEAVTAARENGIHKGESLSGFIWRQCEGLRKSQAENAPLSKLFVVLCKQRGNLNEEIIYRAVDEASDAIKKLTA